MQQNIFHVTLELRIDWSEMDHFMHVNNVSFFKYIQASRVNYWERTSLIEMHKKNNIGPILASCKCDFKAPLFYPGTITVQARVDVIKNTSFCIHHQIIDHKGEIAAEAYDVIVMYDFNKNEKTAIPLEFRNEIEKIEGKTF